MKKNKYKFNLEMVQLNLELYLCSIIDKPNNKNEQIYFAIGEDYTKAKNNLSIETNSSKFQKQFDLSTLEFLDFVRLINKIIKLNKSLIKEFNLEIYDDFQRLLTNLYDYNNQNFYTESTGNDYLRGMHVCLTQTLHIVQKINNNLSNNMTKLDYEN